MKTSILVVDDETASLSSAERMLRLEGYDEITTCSRPTEVEGLLETHAFDAAFLDITMPELDGLDLLKIIKERAPATECIMVTANQTRPLSTTTFSSARTSSALRRRTSGLVSWHRKP